MCSDQQGQGFPNVCSISARATLRRALQPSTRGVALLRGIVERVYGSTAGRRSRERPLPRGTDARQPTIGMPAHTRVTEEVGKSVQAARKTSAMFSVYLGLGDAWGRSGTFTTKRVAVSRATALLQEDEEARIVASVAVLESLRGGPARLKQTECTQARFLLLAWPLALARGQDSEPCARCLHAFGDHNPPLDREDDFAELFPCDICQCACFRTIPKRARVQAYSPMSVICMASLRHVVS